MKRLISILCIFAIIFSFCMVSANAEGNTVTLVKDASSTENTLVYNVVFSTDLAVKSVKIFYDLSEVYAISGATITGATVDAKTFNPSSAQKVLATVWNDTSEFTGTLNLGKLTIKLPENAPAFTIKVTDGSNSRTKSVIGLSSTNTFTEQYTFGTVAYTPAPSVKTITKTEGKDAIVNNATELKDKKTDVEIGGAAGFAFTIPKGVTLDNNMIWSLTTAGGKLYSEKINAGLSVLTGDVQVAATFVTGTHKGADAANTEITAVNGIFKAGEDFYFTDATDAKNQAAAE